MLLVVYRLVLCRFFSFQRAASPTPEPIFPSTVIDRVCFLQNKVHACKIFIYMMANACHSFADDKIRLAAVPLHGLM